MSQSLRSHQDPTMDVAHQVPLTVGFPRQEYCSWLPFPSPGDLPDSGIEPTSLSLLNCRRILYPGKERQCHKCVHKTTREHFMQTKQICKNTHNQQNFCDTSEDFLETKDIYTYKYKTLNTEDMFKNV